MKSEKQAKQDLDNGDKCPKYGNNLTYNGYRFICLSPFCDYMDNK